MYIKKLTIEHFGRIEYKSFNFCESLNVLAGEDTRAVFAALCVALCNRLLRFQVSPYCFMENSRIYAEIEAGGADYVSETVYSADAPEHCETNVYCGRRKLTEEERRAVFHVSMEEEECSYFVNRYDYCRYVPFAELDYSKKLAEYRKALQEENRQEFSERTDGAGTTHTFRRELKRFCDGFLPQQIRARPRPQPADARVQRTLQLGGVTRGDRLFQILMQRVLNVRSHSFFSLRFKANYSEFECIVPHWREKRYWWDIFHPDCR